MEDYYFEVVIVGSVKAKSQEEAERKINSHNVVGATLVTGSRNGHIKLNKIRVNDCEVTHEPTAV